MPNTASAKKSVRQTAKRRLHNRTRLSALRTAVKKFRKLIESGDSEATQQALHDACRRLDQAAAKNLIHKNAAARSKSRLSRAAKGLQK